MAYASHTLYMLLYNAKILLETSHALPFQYFLLPKHSQAILVVCPHCVLWQKTNLPVIRRHQSRNQGLGSAWSISHAQNIRSLGRLGSNRTRPTFNLYAFWCNGIWVPFWSFHTFLTCEMLHFYSISSILKTSRQPRPEVVNEGRSHDSGERGEHLVSHQVSPGLIFSHH